MVGFGAGKVLAAGGSKVISAFARDAAEGAESSTASTASRLVPDEGPSGPVTFRAPPGSTPEEVAQVQEYCNLCNEALEAGALSPTGRVSTQGELRAAASRAAAQERRAAIDRGEPYSGQAGHVPDTTWTGEPEPYTWLDLTPRVNTSLGGQAVHYPIGYRPTRFEFME
jgi:hypothetical protein